MAKTGVLEYNNGTIREYRSPEEVFSESSLGTVPHAAVTENHPSKFVNSRNYKRLAKGYVGEAVEKTDAHINGYVILTDAETIRKVENRELVELSPGYEVEIDETPGIAPDGTRYDQKQTNIRHNHWALLPVNGGRAGPEVSLRLDSNGQGIPPRRQLMKHEIKIGGVTYSFESQDASVKQALDGELGKVAGLQSRLDSAEKDIQTEKGKVATLENELKKATDPKAIKQRIDARLALEKQALGLKPELKCDGLSDKEIMVQALGTGFSLEDSDEFIKGAFTTAKPVATDALGNARKALESPRQDANSDESEVVDTLREYWRKGA